MRFMFVVLAAGARRAGGLVSPRRAGAQHCIALSSWGGETPVPRSQGSPSPPRPRPDARSSRQRPVRDGASERRGGGASGSAGGASRPFRAAHGASERARVGGQEQKWTRRERQPRHWDAFFTGDVADPDMLYGVSPVLAALRSKRRTFHALYVQDSMDESKRKDKAALREVLQLAEDLEVDVRRLDKEKLNEAVGSVANQRPHQGLVLCASKLDFAPLDFAPTTEDTDAVWLALDELADPQNLGALLRTAKFLGAAGVVTCAKNSAPLSATVSKASSGALESLVVHATDNMVDFLEASKAEGWRCLGASVGKGAQPLRHVHRGTQPTILVLGSEGRGLRTNVMRAVDSLVKIDAQQQGDDDDLDSLNVSVAGAILMYHFLSRTD